MIVLTLTSIDINAQKKIKFKDLNLKTALLDLGYDFNKNQEIEISEIDTVKKLNISKRNINRLDDLIHFKSLRILNAMTNNIPNLDVFFNNSVIEELYVGENKLGKKLVLKNLPKLTGLFAFRNSIESIELVNTDKIEQMYLQGNFLQTFEFKNLSKLRSLQLDENTKLTKIDVTKNVELKQLYLRETLITKLDITNNLILKTLYIEQNVELIKTKEQENLKAMPVIRSSN